MSSSGFPVRVVQSVALTLGSSTFQHGTATLFDASILQWLHVAGLEGTPE
jgi:hypothetical protein